MATTSEVASRIVGALEVSEPELDTGVGTPVRKIIDTVAEAISETTIDSFLTSYQYDIDSRQGADLDAFASLFGFFRMTARRSSGVILLQRTTAAPESIIINSGSQASTGGQDPVIVQTLVPAVFPRGGTVIEIPVESVEGGARGDIGAGQITRWLSSIEGLTSVTNPQALSGGADTEDDVQFRERVKRTMFRNLAGTRDMYLGVGRGQRNTSQAEVYGAFERWTERIEIVNQTGSPSIASMPWLNPMALCAIPSSDTTSPAPGVVNTDQHHNLFIGDHVFVSSVTGGTGNVAMWSGLRRVRNVYSDRQVQLEDENGVLLAGTVVAGTATLRRVLRMSGAYDRNYSLGVNLDNNEAFSRTAYTVDFSQVPPVVASLDSSLIPDGVYDFSFIYSSQASRNRPFRSLNVISDRVDLWVDGVTPERADTVSVLDGNNQMGTGSFFAAGAYRRRNGQRPAFSSLILPLPLQPIVTAPTSISVGTEQLLLGEDYHIVDWMPEGEAGSMEALSGLEFVTTGGKAVTAGAQPVTWNSATGPVQINFTGTPFVEGQRVMIEGTDQVALNGKSFYLIDTGTGQLALDGTPPMSPTGGTARLYHPVSASYSFNAAPLQAQRNAEDWRMLGQDALVHAVTPVPLRINVAVILHQGFGQASLQQALESAAIDVLDSAGIGGTLQISDLLNALGDVTGVDAVRMLAGSDVASRPVTDCVSASPGATLTVGAHTFSSGDWVSVQFVNTTNPGVNGFWQVSSIGATTITLNGCASGSGYTHDGRGVVTAAEYAIVGMSRDGSAPVSLYSDRSIRPAKAIDVFADSSERFVLHSVNAVVKAQNTWSVAP